MNSQEREKMLGRERKKEKKNDLPLMWKVFTKLMTFANKYEIFSLSRRYSVVCYVY